MYENILNDDTLIGWIIVIRKIVTTIVLSSGLIIGGKVNSQKEFNYEYRVVLNSNSMGDILIDKYNEIIEYLDPSLHQDAVINNISKFAKDGSLAKYEDGAIVVYIGEAKGNSLQGELKKNMCDTSGVRVKFYFSKSITSSYKK